MPVITHGRSNLLLLTKCLPKPSKGRTLDYNAFHDPNDVACVLKMYVRELPTQLISPALYSHFIDPNNYEDASQAVCLIRETILAKIPAQHLRLLEALFGLFNAISRHEATNRMGAKNLAICWSPNLVYSDSLEEQMRYMKACQATVAFMIENYEQLFLQ